MDDGQLQLLWVGFRTLQSFQESCLNQKKTVIHRVSSFEAALQFLQDQSADIIVLSMSARGRQLSIQLEQLRERSPSSLLTAVVCHDEEVDGALAAGADDVMSLERDGDLVCSPVLRWIDMRHSGSSKLIDLRGVTRQRMAIEVELHQLRSEVKSLTRQVILDSASGVFGRRMFILQSELAAQLLSRTKKSLHLCIFELNIDANDWGDAVVGGFLAQISEILNTMGGPESLVGRLSPSRFAIALTRGTHQAIDVLSTAICKKFRAMVTPHGPLKAEVLSASLQLEETNEPMRRLIECMENELVERRNHTQIYRRLGNS